MKKNISLILLALTISYFYYQSAFSQAGVQNRQANLPAKTQAKPSQNTVPSGLTNITAKNKCQDLAKQGIARASSQEADLSFESVCFFNLYAYHQTLDVMANVSGVPGATLIRVVTSPGNAADSPPARTFASYDLCSIYTERKGNDDLGILQGNNAFLGITDPVFISNLTYALQSGPPLGGVERLTPEVWLYLDPENAMNDPNQANNVVHCTSFYETKNSNEACLNTKGRPYTGSCPLYHAETSRR